MAGLIVIMTVIAVFLAFTVPPQWSKRVARERDKQTIFAMKQYAQAIRNYQIKHNAVPTSLDQIIKARDPRMIRGKEGLICPLTGKADWIVIPASAAQNNAPAVPGQPPPGGGAGGGGGMIIGYPGANRAGQQGSQQPQQATQGQPGGFVGPIIGVRPNKTGPSFLTLNGQTNYEQWTYTTVNLENEILGRRNAMLMK